MDPMNTMESPDISFLTNVQQDVFTILCSLFPNFSHDVLIDSVTSEVNYIPENQNSTVLLNSCIDDLSNRVPLVDFTGGFTPDLSVITPMETEEVAAGGLTTPRPPEAILTLPSTSCAGGLTTPRPPEANLTLPSTSRNENPPEEESKPGMYQKDAEKTIGQPLTDTHDSISDEEEEHAAVVESGVFTPDLSVITPMETEEVVGGGPTIPRPPEANLTLPSTSRKENPPEEESKPGMYPKEAEKTIGQPLTDTHDSISDEEEEHTAVVESADSEDISDEVIVVADGSDYSSSPPAITIESDSEETSDHIQTNNNDTEEESNRLKETKIETGCPILLGTYRDPMNTPLKQQDQITGSDLGAVSMGIDPDVFSHDSSAGNSGVVSRETQRPAIGVSSSIWHTSEVVGATSSFKSHDCVAETSHMSFNVMVNSSIISGKVVSEMSSATDRNVLSDLTKDGPSISLHGLNKSLVTPILTQTAAHSSTGSILCKEAKELKFDLAKYCDQTFNVKSQKNLAGIPNESCVTTHGISGQSQVIHNPPERCSEYKKTGGPKFPPIITVPPKTFHTPSTSKHAAKRFDSSYCRVHHGVKNCNCRSELGSLSYSSSSLGSSKIDSSVSQPKKRKVECNEHNNTISESHHHSFLGSSNVHSTHTGLAGTSLNSFPLATKGKEIGKWKGKEKKEMVAKFNGVSTNTLQGYECSTNRSDMNDKTEDVRVGNNTGHLECLPHSIKSTTSITNADRPAGTSQSDLLHWNDFKLSEKTSVVSETGESDSASILNSATPRNVCKDAPIRPPKSTGLPWTGATNIAPKSMNNPTNPQRVFQPYPPSRLDLPSTSNGPVMPHCPVAPWKPSTSGIPGSQNTRPGMHAASNLVVHNARQALVPSKQGTSWQPESSASSQGFLPRNVALANRQASNAADTNRFQTLPNDFLLGREATETVTPGVTPCNCQVMGRPCSCPFPGAGIIQETKKKDLTEMLAQVRNLFPDASPDFVSEKLKTGSMSYPDPVQWLCNLMIEEAYPRKPPETKAKPVQDEKGKKKMKQNYLHDWRELPRRWLHESYCKQVRQVLASVYKMISMTSIDAVMKATKGRLSPALYVLDQVLESKEFKETVKNQAISSSAVNSAPLLCLNLNLPGEINDLVNGNRKESKVFRIKVNKKARSFVAPWTDEEILTEIEEYRCYQEGVQVELDHQLAIDINQKEYDQNQQGIECECCFAEFPFENMVQCFEMHLFCEDCLQRYVKEAIYGQGKGNLACMAPECGSTFPRDQLEKTLAPDILAKYDERCSEESVHKADLENLVRCPHCDYAAILAPELKAFLCHQCGKETCRSCQVDWMEHFGRKCEEVKSEEALRTKYEEKLSEALIRTCNKCKASIVKENGCNKMTCRCGAKMCYICRKPDIDYNHFCQHLRDPHMKSCSKCNACCLWEVAEKVDHKNMTKIKDELKKEQDEKGISWTNRTVGVPDHLSPGQSK